MGQYTQQPCPQLHFKPCPHAASVLRGDTCVPNRPCESLSQPCPDVLALGRPLRIGLASLRDLSMRARHYALLINMMGQTDGETLWGETHPGKLYGYHAHLRWPKEPPCSSRINRDQELTVHSARQWCTASAFHAHTSGRRTGRRRCSSTPGRFSRHPGRSPLQT